MLHGHLFATATKSILNERCISEFGRRYPGDDSCVLFCAKHQTILISGF
jgi:hypothetical protein